MNKLEIEYMNVDDIIPYENNPRKNDEAVEKVANSIKEFGFKVPIIIDKENVIVTGHTRLLAAKKLNLKEVPVIRAEDLTEKQIKAFRLADNKVSEFSYWDYDKLNLELEDLDFDMEEFGFENMNIDTSYIDNLLEEEYVGTSDNDLFSVTFVFSKEYQEKMMEYIKENGKEPLVEEIIKKVCEEDA